MNGMSGSATPGFRTERHSDPTPPRPYQVFVTYTFVVLALLSSTLVAFAIGRTARVVFLDRSHLALLEQQHALLVASITRAESNIDHKKPNKSLPTPVLTGGKSVPNTLYTSKHFDTSRTSSSDSRWVLAESPTNDLGQASLAAKNEAAIKPAYDEEEEEDEEHLPAGQHLLIDIENVDGQFLNSEERLAEAMITLVNECGLTLLSYHCHELVPTGVSCVGVLLESHVSFHTWPLEGVITLDLFTCGPNSLLPVVPEAERLFGVPISTPSLDGKPVKAPRMLWAHKLRGFRDEEGARDDLDLFYDGKIGDMTDYKKEITTTQTNFQKVVIYDLLRPGVQTIESYLKSLSNDGSYEAQNPQFFAPDRLVFLDGALQSRRTGDAAYHEALVHPAMFAHHNPKRVAIIGGGEGATLREVLKHDTVETVVMIEIDEMMVEVSRKYIPEWSDCSNIAGSRDSCIDDPRAQMYFEDALKWFEDRFGADSTIEEEPFDVIIMDALDPQIQPLKEGGEFAKALYNGDGFLGSLYNGLTDHGILLAQVGQSPRYNEPAEEHSWLQNRLLFLKALAHLGFESIQDYNEGHCMFSSPWHFVIAGKSMEAKANWLANEAIVNLRLRERARPTVSGESPFLHFDGATMMQYQYPPKNAEVVFCRRNPLPEGCEIGHGFPDERHNIPTNVALEVKKPRLGDGSSLSVYAAQGLPKDSYVGLESLVHNVAFGHSTNEIIKQLKNHWSYSYVGKSIDAYLHGCGFSGGRNAGYGVFALSSIHSFINKICTSTNEHIFDIEMAASEVVVDSAEYNPLTERQATFTNRGVLLQAVEKGEELIEAHFQLT